MGLLAGRILPLRNGNMPVKNPPEPFPRFRVGFLSAFQRLFQAAIPVLSQKPGAVCPMDDGLAPAWRGIAGYSLAGLFAIYALYRTDLFSRAASVSGSLWYPGFRDFIISSQLRARPDRLYLSLGDRESKGSTSTVLGNTEAIAAHFSSIGISTLFELNPGNHFTDPAGRTAKGIDFITDGYRHQAPQTSGI